ncbi:REST corepressor 2 [Blomia tropicalis]|nr:REST corepressor 2 [Blomia tropicalis]
MEVILFDEVNKRVNHLPRLMMKTKSTRIQIGDDHQVQIPALVKNNRYRSRERETLLWKPDNGLTEYELDMYLEYCTKNRRYTKEQALITLNVCKYDLRRAIETVHQYQPNIVTLTYDQRIFVKRCYNHDYLSLDSIKSLMSNYDTNQLTQFYLRLETFRPKKSLFAQLTDGRMRRSKQFPSNLVAKILDNKSEFKINGSTILNIVNHLWKNDSIDHLPMLIDLCHRIKLLREAIQNERQRNSTLFNELSCDSWYFDWFQLNRNHSHRRDYRWSRFEVTLLVAARKFIHPGNYKQLAKFIYTKNIYQVAEFSNYHYHFLRKCDQINDNQHRHKFIYQYFHYDERKKIFTLEKKRRIANGLYNNTIIPTKHNGNIYDRTKSIIIDIDQDQNINSTESSDSGIMMSNQSKENDSMLWNVNKAKSPITYQTNKLNNISAASSTVRGGSFSTFIGFLSNKMSSDVTSLLEIG